MTDKRSPARIAITGLGVVTPLGWDLDTVWESLLAGRSGIGPITLFDPDGLPCQIAGEVPDFTPGSFMTDKQARRTSRASQLALAAAKLAAADAGLDPPLEQPEREGVYLGTAAGGVDRLDEGIETVRTEGYDRVNPFAAPSVLPNMVAFHVTEHFGAVGPNSTITTACAAGTQAIGEAAHVIRSGRADRIIVIGSEAIIRDFVLAGFSAMRALPTSFNDTPEAASRPFDADREGFVLAEGAACLVLERLDLARARDAHIYAEVLGYASSNDAYHMAAPHPEALGAIRTIKWALEDAGLDPQRIDYINAHGTSTPANDAAETLAIKSVFGARAAEIPISSTKSMLGHAMGASGAIEAVVCALSIDGGWIHPTINYETPDPDCDLDYVPNQPQEASIRYALSNSFGLGGQNACLVFGSLNSR